jgi:hypothetical protein
MRQPDAISLRDHRAVHTAKEEKKAYAEEAKIGARRQKVAALQCVRLGHMAHDLQGKKGQGL